MGNGAAGSERLHPFEAVRIGGLETAVITRAALAELMVGDAITARRKREVELPKLIFPSHGQGISFAATNRGFAAASATAALVHADGISVALASPLLPSLPLPARAPPPA